MPDQRFEFLAQPLHELQERLKAELAGNPFHAPVRHDPADEDRPGGDEGPASQPAED